MKWTFADAVNIALGLHEEGQMASDQLDDTVKWLWEEMQQQNEQMDAQGGQGEI